MRHFVLAFDSFKGSLTSGEAADAFAEGLCCSVPDAVVSKICIADGGEGSIDAVVKTMNGGLVAVETVDPLGRRMMARYGIVDDGKTAVIEMAQASGLTLLAPGERNPLLTSTYGTGLLMADALDRGCRKMLVCIGGSATNDGGMGMLNALGCRFLDADGNMLGGCGADLEKVTTIDSGSMDSRMSGIELVVACDVQNPLYGHDGAAYVFAPQKGADADMTERLDKGLRNYAEVINRCCGIDVSRIPGAGAAGGTGAGLVALLGARLERGIDMVLEAVHFDELLKTADAVVTGEGRIDGQTLMGKALSGILSRAERSGVPVFAFAGRVEWCDELLESGFAAIHQISDEHQPLEMAMRRDVAYANMREAAVRFGLGQNLF